MMKNTFKFLLVFMLLLTSGCKKSVDESDFIFNPHFLLNQESVNLRIKLQNQSEQELNNVVVKFYLKNINNEEKILVKQFDQVHFYGTELKYFEFEITSFRDENIISNEQILNNEFEIDFEIIL